MLATVLYERNDLDEAARSSRLAVKWSELSGYAELRIAAYYCLAQKLLARGDFAEADREMAKGDEASQQSTSGPLGRAWHVANRVQYAVQRDDLQSAEAWGQKLAEYNSDPLWVWTGLASPRLLIARGDKKTAATQLLALHKRAIDADALGYATRVRVYQAIAAVTEEEALGFLADALKVGEPEGFIRTFVDEGKLLAPLLRKAKAHGITPEYAATLLNIIHEEDRNRSARGGDASRPAASAGLLSQREMEVLGLLSQGLSDRQISSRLMIGLSTAKTHVHRIIEKLNATSRTQAVSRARELKLV